MEGDNGKASAGCQQIKNFVQALIQSVQLSVHSNAQGLEASARRILILAADCRRHSSCNGICQLKGGFKGFFLTLALNAACNGPGIGFLAVFAQDACQLFPAGGVHQICGSRAGLAHAHIQRSVRPVGKASFGIVQLVRGNPQVQQCSVDGVDAKALQSGPCIAEVGLHQGRRQSLQPLPCGGDRVRVLIQTDESACVI